MFLPHSIIIKIEGHLKILKIRNTVLGTYETTNKEKFTLLLWAQKRKIYIIGNFSKILKTYTKIYMKNETYMKKCVVTERDPVTGRER